MPDIKIFNTRSSTDYIQNLSILFRLSQFLDARECFFIFDYEINHSVHKIWLQSIIRFLKLKLSTN